MERRLITLSDHVPRKTEWLWPGRIPYGALTLVEGNPGANKSTLVYDIAARVTTGRTMYGSTLSAPPASVILFQAEDTLDTMYQNLEAAGADLTKVQACNAHLAGGLYLPDSIDFLTEQAESKAAKLIVFDPITAYSTASLTNEQAARKLTQPLAALAAKLGAAVVPVRHLTKSGGADPLYRGAGGIGLIAASRSALLVGCDPADEHCRIVAQSKSSLGPPATSLSFRVVARGNGFAIEWLGDSGYSAAQLLQAGSSHSGGELNEAAYKLYSFLGDGPLPESEVQSLARSAGIAPRTLRRAKVTLGVKSERKGFGTGSVFWWHLPNDQALVRRLRDKDLTELERKLFGLDPQEPRPTQYDKQQDNFETGRKPSRRRDDDTDCTSSPC